MPPGLIWLKATITEDPEATAQMVSAIANAVELQWVMDLQDAAAAHLATALAPSAIARLATPIAR